MPWSGVKRQQTKRRKQNWTGATARQQRIHAYHSPWFHLTEGTVRRRLLFIFILVWWVFLFSGWEKTHRRPSTDAPCLLSSWGGRADHGQLLLRLERTRRSPLNCADQNKRRGPSHRHDRMLLLDRSDLSDRASCCSVDLSLHWIWGENASIHGNSLLPIGWIAVHML